MSCLWCKSKKKFRQASDCGFVLDLHSLFILLEPCALHKPLYGRAGERHGGLERVVHSQDDDLILQQVQKRLREAPSPAPFTLLRRRASSPPRLYIPLLALSDRRLSLEEVSSREAGSVLVTGTGRPNDAAAAAPLA